MEELREENRLLQQEYEEYIESSRQIEEELQNSINSLEADNCSLAAQLDEARQRAASLSKALDSAVDESSRLKTEKKKLLDRVQELETTEEMLKKSCRMYAASLENLQGKFEAAQEDAIMLTTDIEEACAERRAGLEREARLKMDLEEALGELNARGTHGTSNVSIPIYYSGGGPEQSGSIFRASPTLPHDLAAAFDGLARTASRLDHMRASIKRSTKTANETSQDTTPPPSPIHVEPTHECPQHGALYPQKKKDSTLNTSGIFESYWTSRHKSLLC